MFREIDMWHVKYNEKYIEDINQRLQTKFGFLGKQNINSFSSILWIYSDLL